MGIINRNETYFKCNPTHNDTNITEEEEYVPCNTYIGHSESEMAPISFLVISLLGLILNLILIKDIIIKSNASSRKQSSMKKLFAVLPILDCITSIYWLISSLVFKNAQEINNKQIGCWFLSIIYFSVFTFEFIFINFILIHFRKISLNPIEGILKPGKNILKYITICVLLTLIILGFGIQVIGRSPMTTCFINTEQSGSSALIFLISVISTICVIVQVIYDLTCRQLFINDKEVREAYKINSMYILVFSLLHIFMFLLIIMTSIKDIPILPVNTDLINYTYFSTLITCSIPMITGFIRNCRGFTKLKKVKQFQRKVTKNLNRQKTKEQLCRNFSRTLTEILGPEDQFDWLEKHAMEYFMRDILLSVSHCIYSSKSYGKNIYLQDLEKENETIIKHRIGFDNFKLEDPSVSGSEFLDIKVIEYAPKIFAYLRNLEHIDIGEMSESFLPKNNKQGISESQGKSGSFFLSTDDNQYMIKTLRVDEFDLIRKTFLNEYVSYITKNTGSLLCRIYGMYSIIMSQGDEMLIIVMRNVIGEFRNNIIAKYDLKGSSANRTSDFDMDKSDVGTMKDLNFNEFEKGIMIDRNSIKRLRKLTKYDSYFLSTMDLMDYSLFLVKITLTKEQARDIFGDKIQEKQDSAFNELIYANSIIPSSSIISIMNNEQNLKINFDNMNMDDLKPRPSIIQKGEIFHNIKYYKQYLFPSLIPGSAYILAIIDYFQYFNFYKYVESGLKTKFGKKKDNISCVDPKTYYKRFTKYFEKLTDIKHMLKDGQKTDDNNSQGKSTNSNEEDEENNSSDLAMNNESDIELGHMV